MIVTYQTRWITTQHTTFDNGTADDFFAKQLSASQNGTTEFTHRAIDEYKKFILLCCISPTGAAPPKKVAENILGTAPPVRIWPPPGKKHTAPNAPPTRENAIKSLTTVFIFLLPFLFCALAFRQHIPCILSHPQLPLLSTIYTIYILLTLSPYLLHKQHHIQTIATRDLRQFIVCRPLPFPPMSLPLRKTDVMAVEQTILMTIKRKHYLQFNPNNL